MGGGHDRREAATSHPAVGREGTAPFARVAKTFRERRNRCGSGLATHAIYRSNGHPAVHPIQRAHAGGDHSEVLQAAATEAWAGGKAQEEKRLDDGVL